MTKEEVFTREEIKQIAKNNDLGEVRFEERLAQNTGRMMQVAYVFDDEKQKHLFAKWTSFGEGFFLCNDYAQLA